MFIILFCQPILMNLCLHGHVLNLKHMHAISVVFPLCGKLSFSPFFPHTLFSYYRNQRRGIHCKLRADRHPCEDNRPTSSLSKLLFMPNKCCCTLYKLHIFSFYQKRTPIFYTGNFCLSFFLTFMASARKDYKYHWSLNLVSPFSKFKSAFLFISN